MLNLTGTDITIFFYIFFAIGCNLILLVYNELRKASFITFCFSSSLQKKKYFSFNKTPPQFHNVQKKSLFFYWRLPTTDLPFWNTKIYTFVFVVDYKYPAWLMTAFDILILKQTNELYDRLTSTLNRNSNLKKFKGNLVSFQMTSYILCHDFSRQFYWRPWMCVCNIMIQTYVFYIISDENVKSWLSECSFAIWPLFWAFHFLEE